MELTVTKGKRYLWTPGPSEISLLNADALSIVSETYTTQKSFIAYGDTLVATVTPLALVTATLLPQIAWQNHRGGLIVQSWRKHPFAGERRLFFAGLDGFINLYEYGFTDMLADEHDALKFTYVQHELTTRGYTCGDMLRKNFRRAKVNVKTWDPEFSIAARFDGVNETNLIVEDETKSRELYYEPFDQAPYDVTNANDDHGTRLREDYAIIFPEPEASGGAPMDFGINGFEYDLHQESTEPLSFRGQGTFCQFNITGTRGRVGVQNLVLEALAGPRKMEVLA